jgi:hypothetical protein
MYFQSYFSATCFGSFVSSHLQAELFQEGNIVYIQLTMLADYVISYYEGWNFNSGNYLFTTDTK